MGALVSGALFRSLRPWQWVKNVAVLLPVLFGRKLGDPAALAGAIAAFIAFSAAASAGYLWNDVLDRDSDRRHPTKRDRPIAAGRVSARTAVTTARVLLIVAFVIAYLGPTADRVTTLELLAAYAAQNLLYSTFAKRVPVLDVAVIAVGFLLRVLAGGAASGVPVSRWLTVCALLVAAFLGFGKRVAELERHGAAALGLRATYSPALARALLWLAAAALFTTYAWYTVAARTVAEFGSMRLLWTTPLALAGILRATWAFRHLDDGEDPARLLIRDRWLGAIALLWLAAVTALIAPWRSA